MVVAVTGAQGFLGSSTARALKKAGHRVRGLAFGQKEGRTRLGPVVDEWVAGDLNSPEALAGLTSGAQAVIHIAIDWAALNEGPLPNFERNLLGSLRLLEQARTSKVQQVLFVSTVDVYHEVVPDRAIDEAQPTWPAGIYGAQKAAVELHLKAYHHAYGLNTSAWRPATMYGVNPALERSHWFELVTEVKDGRAISTDQVGNVVSVEDVAEALTLAVGDPSVSGEFYNLVDDSIEWQHVAEIARELSGSKAAITGRPSAGPSLRFDTSKAVAFFERHGNRLALRRGMEGVREYVGALLTAAEAGSEPPTGTKSKKD